MPSTSLAAFTTMPASTQPRHLFLILIVAHSSSCLTLYSAVRPEASRSRRAARISAGARPLRLPGERRRGNAGQSPSQRSDDREMTRIENAIGESEEALQCIDTRIAGGSCDSLLDRVSKAGKSGMSHIRDTFDSLNDMATDITMLLVAIAIKNILFPILFLMGAARCGLPVARHASRLLCGFEKDAEELKDTMRTHLEGPGRDLKRSEP